MNNNSGVIFHPFVHHCNRLRLKYPYETDCIRREWLPGRVIGLKNIIRCVCGITELILVKCGRWQKSSMGYVNSMTDGSMPFCIIHEDVIKWKQFPPYWSFVWGIHRWPEKGQWSGALMRSLISAWTHGWANSRDAGDLRRQCAHYDITVIIWSCSVINHVKMIEQLLHHAYIIHMQWMGWNIHILFAVEAVYHAMKPDNENVCHNFTAPECSLHNWQL